MQTPHNLRYTSSHEWIAQDGTTFTIGITDHAQEALGDIVFLELPKVGQKVEAAQACAVVESVKAASDIYAPLSGTIVQVNTAITQNPEAVNQVPYESWLFKIEAPLDTAIDHLLTADAYLAGV